MNSGVAAISMGIPLHLLCLFVATSILRSGKRNGAGFTFQFGDKNSDEYGPGGDIDDRDGRICMPMALFGAGHRSKHRARSCSDGKQEEQTVSSVKASA